MTDPDDFAPVYDMTGTPAHAKLRAYWEVPPGGRGDIRRTTGRAGKGDIVANIVRAYVDRSRAIYEANHPAAVAAHADYEAGMTWTALEQKYHLSDTTLRLHWRNEGLPYQTGRRSTP